MDYTNSDLINFINLGPLVLKAYIATSFSFIDNGVDRTRPASNGLTDTVIADKPSFD